jgi:DNA polymerase (family 10)
MKAPLPLAEAVAIAHEVADHLSPIAQRVMIAGSIRRHKPTVGDIDIVVLPKADGDLAGALRRLDPAVRGRSYFTLAHRGAQVNVLPTTAASFGAALLHATGSARYNTALRAKAKGLGLKLNQYGLFDRAGRMLAGESEEDIYKALGRPRVRPPDQR